MPNRILNTNMGLGFQRGRKYDTDLDRLGRIETSHGELRKTRELNLQSEMKKLKESIHTYSIRRFSMYPYQVTMTEEELRAFSDLLQREFGMGDVVGAVANGARDLTGNVVEGAGKVIGSGVGKAVGFGAGLLKGGSIGATIGSAFGPVGTVAGGVLGTLAGPLIGKNLVGTVGSTLKNIGQDIHT